MKNTEFIIGWLQGKDVEVNIYNTWIKLVSVFETDIIPRNLLANCPMRFAKEKIQVRIWRHRHGSNIAWFSNTMFTQIDIEKQHNFIRWITPTLEYTEE